MAQEKDVVGVQQSSIPECVAINFRYQSVIHSVCLMSPSSFYGLSFFWSNIGAEGVIIKANKLDIVPLLLVMMEWNNMGSFVENRKAHSQTREINDTRFIWRMWGS